MPALEPDQWWMRQGACAGEEPEVFLDPVHVARALSVCRRCPVMVQCGAYAEAYDERVGVWGGRLLG